jgi:hypothetical protein
LSKRPIKIMRSQNPKVVKDFNLSNGPNFGECPRRFARTQRIYIG